MTKKQKILQYEQAAHFVRLSRCLGAYEAVRISGLLISKELDMLAPDYLKAWSLLEPKHKELRETILLSCAELVRLDFEIE